MIEKEDYLLYLNQEQFRSVTYANGPLLILAGAGTGKTTVLTSRIVYLVKKKHLLPSEVLAVTFTNKAANEMRYRLENFLGIDITSSMKVGTFHEISANILRVHAKKLGYTSDFIIINQDDQIRLIKKIIQDFRLDEKSISAKILLHYINKFKNRTTCLKDMHSKKVNTHIHSRFKEIYQEYQKNLKVLNFMDFADLILRTIELFDTHSDICEYYQKKFKSILIDEYQDINASQYIWIKILSEKYKNICCVGDDDQAIYGWRGADVSNILQFDKDYPSAKVIRLEKNYRSTQHILYLASSLISNNKNRHHKVLWTDKTDGEKAIVTKYYDDKEEAMAIASKIDTFEKLRKIRLSNIAILVRAGYQTRNFEESLNLFGVPYKILGSTKFYERSEIKDCIAYIRMIVNVNDNLAFERIVNIPKRGIGKTTIANIVNYIKSNNNISLFEASKRMLEEKKIKGKTADSLATFINIIKKYNYIGSGNEHSIVQELLNVSGYIDMLRNNNKYESRERLENVYELIKSLKDYKNLSSFLEHVTLVSDAGSNSKVNKEGVNIMTMHKAKGLEFDCVFLPGWEEGLFPNLKYIEEKKECDIEEERRLAYVAITRAKKRLFISYTSRRMTYGEFQDVEMSRFIKELPKSSYEIVEYRSNIKKVKFNSKMYENDIKYHSDIGSIVKHFQLGTGVVLSTQGDISRVFFKEKGIKNMPSSSLKKL